jgi:hypothetical protein
VADFDAHGTQNDRLAAALAACLSVRAAAAAAGLSERNAHRRSADPEFRRRVDAIRGAMVDSAAGRLADGMTQAADVLRALLTNQTPNVRLRAAVANVQLAIRVRPGWPTTTCGRGAGGTTTRPSPWSLPGS